MEEMKLAFAVTVIKSLIDADGRTDYAEYRLFGRIFPRHRLLDAGLIDEAGHFTSKLDALAQEARETLPSVLPHAERLDVAALFYGAAIADNELDPREATVLDEAARLLRVTPEAVRDHLLRARAEDRD